VSRPRRTSTRRPASTYGPASRHARTSTQSADQTAYAAVGIVGEVLITVGVFLLGFLVWQLWWTDVVADRAQADIVAGLDIPTAQPGDPVAVPGDPEAVPVLPSPAHGETFATLTVPRWAGEPVRPISEGTDRATVLDVLGIGHYEKTAMPGDVGNFSIAGHRTTYGKPFHRIAELQAGDILVVTTTDTWYVYEVTETQIVNPDQTEVVLPVPGDPQATPTERLITLTSCHPMYSANQRYIVHGKLKYWAPTSSGTPAELMGG
jgi:sortase A